MTTCGAAARPCCRSWKLRAATRLTSALRASSAQRRGGLQRPSRPACWPGSGPRQLPRPCVMLVRCTTGTRRTALRTDGSKMRELAGATRLSACAFTGVNHHSELAGAPPYVPSNKACWGYVDDGCQSKTAHGADQAAGHDPEQYAYCVVHAVRAQHCTVDGSPQNCCQCHQGKHTC